MKLDNIVLATKAKISNDDDPSGEKSRNRVNQKNKIVLNSKNMVMMIKLEPKRRRNEKTMQKGSTKV